MTRLQHDEQGSYGYQIIISVNHPTKDQILTLRTLRETCNGSVLPHPYLNERAKDMLVETGQYTAVWVHPDGSVDEATNSGGMCRGNPTVAACIADGGCCRRSIACNE